MAYHKKATDEELVDAYNELKSVWKVGERFGMCGQSVHERLVKIGIDTSQNLFTEDDYEMLRMYYCLYRDAGKLKELADKMGRDKTTICGKARALGLTDKNHAAPWAAVWKNAPAEACRPIFDDLKKSRLNAKEFCKKRGYGLSAFTKRMKELFPKEWETMVETKAGRGRLYKKGRDFEYRVKRDMEKKGYTVVRSYASKTPADLTAVRDGQAVFVQCKLHNFYHVNEWNTFIDYCANAGALPVFATRSEDGSTISYYIITGKKDGSRKKQPMVDVDVNAPIEEWPKCAVS